MKMNSLTIAAFMLAVLATTSCRLDSDDVTPSQNGHCDFARMAADGIDEDEELIRIFEQNEDVDFNSEN